MDCASPVSARSDGSGLRRVSDGTGAAIEPRGYVANYDPYTGESTKLERLEADMEEVAASGKKAIVFSQWVGTIDKLRERLARFPHRPVEVTEHLCRLQAGRAVGAHEQPRPCRGGAAAEVGHAHHRELEPLGAVDRHQPDGVERLGLQRRLALARLGLVQLGEVDDPTEQGIPASCKAVNNVVMTLWPI